MIPFLAMLFAFRTGLTVAPVEAPVRSLHDASLTVAADGAETQPAPPVGSVAGGTASGSGRAGWQKILAAIVPGERCAKAAVWLALHPPKVHVSDTKFYVSVHVPTP